MAGLSREYALRVAKEKSAALGNADAEWRAEAWANSVFDSLSSYDQPRQIWRHIPNHSVVDEARTNSIDRALLRGVAAEYIEHYPWLRDRHFDWILADALVFAELSGTTLAFNNISPFSGGLKVGFAAAKIGWQVCKWLAWLVTLFLAYGLGPVYAAVWVGITLLVQVPKYRLIKKKTELLQSMFDVYAALDSATLSWAVVWDLMARSRNLGAVWDPELYRLVELRK